MTNKLTFFIIAGESSGDRLGAELMRGLESEYSGDVAFVGVGGEQMLGEGLESLFPMDDLSVMGIAEVLPRIPKLIGRINETVIAINQTSPSALITIDSPDFCFRVAKKAKSQNHSLPVIHYVAPSVWAWRPKRAKKMARFVDHVLALLPFEPPYMEAEGMSCDFVGHPISDEIQATSAEAAAFRRELGVKAQQLLLTLLPGSRSSEVARLSPVFKEVIGMLRKDIPDLAIVIPSVPSRVEALQQYFSGLDVTILDPRRDTPEEAEIKKRACFKASDAALAASGTVSLELSAAGTAMVIAYKMNWLTAFIKRRLVNVSSATLVNLLTETQAIPEFLLEDCTSDKIYPAIKELLMNEDTRQSQLDVSAKAMEMLGSGKEKTKSLAADSVLRFIQS